jgi:hypothetical protein
MSLSYREFEPPQNQICYNHEDEGNQGFLGGMAGAEVAGAAAWLVRKSAAATPAAQGCYNSKIFLTSEESINKSSPKRLAHLCRRSFGDSSLIVLKSISV